VSLLDEILGKLNGLPQAAQKEIIDQAYKSVKSRIRKGWTVDEALGCPIDRRKQECSIKSLSG